MVSMIATGEAIRSHPPVAHGMDPSEGNSLMVFWIARFGRTDLPLQLVEICISFDKRGKQIKTRPARLTSGGGCPAPSRSIPDS